MKWSDESWAFDDPCNRCGIRRIDHDPAQISHPYRSPAIEEHHLIEGGTWDSIWPKPRNSTERAVIRHSERETYSVELPSPRNRKRLREAAGLTQADVAKRLFVERTTVARWEMPSGYTGDMRLNGREPSGDLRTTYSELLRSIEP